MGISNAELCSSIKKYIKELFDDHVKKILDEHSKTINELTKSIASLTLKLDESNTKEVLDNKTKSYSACFTDIIDQSNVIAKSISKAIISNDNTNKNLMVYNVANDNLLKELLTDLDIDTYSHTTINTKNMKSFKITSNSIIPQNIYHTFYTLPNRSTKYSNIFLRPDLSFEKRQERLVLNIGSKTLADTKCVFNTKSLSYELRYYTSVNNKIVIDWSTDIPFTDNDYKKWSKDSLNKPDSNKSKSN